MATRFSTTAATGSSAVWSPADESILQLDAANNTAQVEILGRVDAAAGWVRLELLQIGQEFVRLPKFPFLMATIVRNVNANQITLRDNLA